MLHSERYKKLDIKMSFEDILHHIAGETYTKHRVVERSVFDRTMAAYSMFKFQNMNIQCYILHKNCGVSDMETRRIDFVIMKERRKKN